MSATQLSDSLSQTHNNSKKGPLMCSNGISKIASDSRQLPKLVKAGVMKQSKGEHGVKMR